MFAKKNIWKKKTKIFPTFLLSDDLYLKWVSVCCRAECIFSIYKPRKKTYETSDSKRIQTFVTYSLWNYWYGYQLTCNNERAFIKNFLHNFTWQRPALVWKMSAFEIGAPKGLKPNAWCAPFFTFYFAESNANCQRQLDTNKKKEKASVNVIRIFFLRPIFITNALIWNWSRQKKSNWVLKHTRKIYHYFCAITIFELAIRIANKQFSQSTNSNCVLRS